MGDKKIQRAQRNVVKKEEKKAQEKDKNNAKR